MENIVFFERVGINIKTGDPLLERVTTESGLQALIQEHFKSDRKVDMFWQTKLFVAGNDRKNKRPLPLTHEANEIICAKLFHDHFKLGE